MGDDLIMVFPRIPVDDANPVTRSRVRLSFVSLMNAQQAHAGEPQACLSAVRALPAQTAESVTLDEQDMAYLYSSCGSELPTPLSPVAPQWQTFLAQFKSDLRQEHDTSREIIRVSNAAILRVHDLRLLVEPGQCVNDEVMVGYSNLLHSLYGGTQTGRYFTTTAPWITRLNQLTDAERRFLNVRLQPPGRRPTTVASASQMNVWRDWLREGLAVNASLLFITQPYEGHWILVEVDVRAPPQVVRVIWRDSLLDSDLPNRTSIAGFMQALTTNVPLDRQAHFANYDFVVERAMPQQQDLSACGAFAMGAMRAIPLGYVFGRDFNSEVVHARYRDLLTLELLHQRIPL